MSMVHNSDFDERQIMVRGKGFQIGFLLAMGLTFLNASFEAGWLPIQVSVYSRLMIFIWTCVTVVSVFFIVKDAYEGINKTGGRALMGIFMFCGIIVLTVMLWGLGTGKRVFVENGVVGDILGEMFYAVSMLIISIVYFAKKAVNKKAFVDEEEE